ncbi:MAG TPA: ABC transporter permease [Chloroflexota bacterium]|nr:ABC transporter permease [Chloroflexota bacterium]
MSRLILERLVHSVFVVLGASVVVYMLLHFTGGDIAASMLPDWATSEQTKEYRRKLGLDLPIHLQYVHWLGGVARGDFGLSFRNDLPAMDLVLERFPATIQLALVAQVIALLVAFPLGVLAAIRRGSWWDRACMGLALIGQSVPHFWLGLMLILLIAVEARWLPVSGREGPQYIILPALTLATAPLAQLARLVRSGMLDMLGQDFVTTARAKGLQEVIVLSRHALANALLPLVTVIGLELGSLLNGSVVVENVFAWPGVGRVLITALQQRDIPVVEAGVFLVAGVYIALNLAVDILYAFIDPRVRYA